MKQFEETQLALGMIGKISTDVGARYSLPDVCFDLHARVAHSAGLLLTGVTSFTSMNDVKPARFKMIMDLLRDV